MANEWSGMNDLVNEMSQAKGIDLTAAQMVPRAKVDILLARWLVEQMRQSTTVIFPALAELVSEVKRHREALVSASDSSDKTARAIVWLTVVIALAAVAQVVVAIVK